MNQLDTPQHDPALDALLGDVAWAVDDDIVRTQAAWDFAAVVARAHALDPEQVPGDVVREVEAAAPIVSLAQQRRARRVTRDDPQFDRILADVRASIEHDAAVGRSAAATPVKPIVPATGRRVMWAVLALAAMLVIAFGLVQGVQYVQLQRDAPADAALHLGEPAESESPAATVQDDPPRARSPAPMPVPEAEPPLLEVDPSATTATAAPRRDRDKTKRGAAPSAPAPSLSDRLAELDAAAAAALRARDLPKAQAAFEEIVKLGGSSRLADLAYGELFHIAHRQSDAAGELALWKRYLQRFPEGRFADDARAGLCRRASGAEKDACWREYLVDFPRGSYVRQAEQHLGGGTP